MWDKLYSKRLRKDLGTWREKGWVTPEGSEAILASVEGRAFAERLPVFIGILGAILLAAAAMTFVAANWNEIPRIVRLFILISAMWTAYGLGWILHRRGMNKFSDTAVFLGAAIFGASIMLVSQIYHIAGVPADGVLMWAAGSLAAAWLGRSRAALALTFAALGVWTPLAAEMHGPHVQLLFLPFYAAAVLLVIQRQWPTGRHLATLTLVFWLVYNLFDLAGPDGYWPENAATLILVQLSILFATAGHWFAGRPAPLAHLWGGTLVHYGLAGLFIFLFVLQISVFELKGVPAGKVHIEVWLAVVAVILAAGLLVGVMARRKQALETFDIIVLGLAGLGGAVFMMIAQKTIPLPAGFPELALKWLAAIGYLALTLWALSWAQRNRSRTASAFALLAFGAEVLYLYFETFGTLLDTALFFLIGGVLFIGLAFVLYRLQRRFTGPAQPEERAS